MDNTQDEDWDRVSLTLIGGRYVQQPDDRVRFRVLVIQSNVCFAGPTRSNTICTRRATANAPCCKVCEMLHRGPLCSIASLSAMLLHLTRVPACWTAVQEQAPPKPPVLVDVLPHHGESLLRDGAFDSVR